MLSTIRPRRARRSRASAWRTTRQREPIPRHTPLRLVPAARHRSPARTVLELLDSPGGAESCRQLLVLSTGRRVPVGGACSCFATPTSISPPLASPLPRAERRDSRTGDGGRSAYAGRPGSPQAALAPRSLSRERCPRPATRATRGCRQWLETSRTLASIASTCWVLTIAKRRRHPRAECRIPPDAAISRYVPEW